MFKVHAVQAHFGDCLLLEYGTAAAPRFTLVDGGPPGTFDPEVKSVLTSKVATHGGKLDRVIVSHVDNDHIVGILDLFSTLREQRDNGEAELVTIDGLWHNAFARTVDPNNVLAPRIAAVLGAGAVATMDHAGVALNGIGEGNKLRQLAQLLNIAINADYPDPIVVDTSPGSTQLGNLKLTIVGPTQANLDALRAEWERWLDEHEDDIVNGDPFLMANADRSIPNLSSICVVAEADGCRVLLTGDARSDHILDGLGKQGILDAAGAAHFDLIKLPHHGSDRNMTKAFFRKITADTYVVSADGTYDNPDLATLIWLVEAAREQGRTPKVIATNETPSTTKLVEEYPPADFGYALTFRPANSASVAIELA